VRYHSLDFVNPPRRRASPGQAILDQFEMAKAQIKVATFDKKPALNINEFFVI
jgi:hypothetical protein